MDNETRLHTLANGPGSFVTPENVHEFRFDREYASPNGRPVYVYTHDDGREVHVDGNGTLYTSSGPKFDANGRPTMRGSIDADGNVIPDGTQPQPQQTTAQPTTQAPAVNIEQGAPVSRQMEQLMRIRGMDSTQIQANENQPPAPEVAPAPAPAPIPNPEPQPEQ